MLSIYIYYTMWVSAYWQYMNGQNKLTSTHWTISNYFSSSQQDSAEKSHLKTHREQVSNNKDYAI